MPKRERKLSVPLGAAFPLELAQEICKRAERDGITVSQLIREAVEEALHSRSRRKHGSTTFQRKEE